MQAYTLIHFLIFVPSFPSGRVAGAAALGGPEILHGQQQSRIVLLATHQAKSEMYCSHASPVVTGGLSPQIEILNTIN